MNKFSALREEKQASIINAALACFGKHGYDKASVKDIADRAHISKASIFQYFGTKKQLYAYMLKYCLEVFVPAFDRAALDAEQDLFERILLSSRMILAVLSKHPFFTSFLTSVWEETSPEVSDLIADLKTNVNRFRSELVLRDTDALRFKKPEDAKAVYEMLLLMAEGYGARYASIPDFHCETVMAEFERYISVLKNNFCKKEDLHG